MIEIIKNNLRDIKILDRLKNDRWKKLGISEELYAGITAIQLDYVNNVLDFCNNFMIVYGNDNKTIITVIDELEKIKPSFEKVVNKPW